MDFFNSLTSFFSLIFDFLVNTIQSLVFLIQIIISSTAFNQQLMNILPPFLSVCVITFSVVSVVKLIVGR